VWYSSTYQIFQKKTARRYFTSPCPTVRRAVSSSSIALTRAIAFNRIQRAGLQHTGSIKYGQTAVCCQLSRYHGVTNTRLISERNRSEWSNTVRWNRAGSIVRPPPRHLSERRGPTCDGGALRTTCGIHHLQSGFLFRSATHKLSPECQLSVDDWQRRRMSSAFASSTIAAAGVLSICPGCEHRRPGPGRANGLMWGNLYHAHSLVDSRW